MKLADRNKIFEKRTSNDERMRVLANYLIDIMIKDYKKGKLRFKKQNVELSKN